MANNATISQDPFTLVLDAFTYNGNLALPKAVGATKTHLDVVCWSGMRETQPSEEAILFVPPILATVNSVFTPV